MIILQIRKHLGIEENVLHFKKYARLTLHFYKRKK